MTVITTRLIVAPDGTISSLVPLPQGAHLASVEVATLLASVEVATLPLPQTPTLPFSADDLPVHDLGPWPEGMSLRREDLYGDDGQQSG